MYAGRLVFAQLMEHLPWQTFRRIVERYGGDHRVREFSCANQYRCMAFAQLAYRESLRGIETCLRAQAAKCKPALQEHMTMVRRLRERNLWYTDYLGDESVFGTGGDASVADYLANRTLIGTVEQVCERLERYRRMGFAEASFIVRFGVISAAQSLHTIEILEKQVRPHFDRRIMAA